MQLCNPPAVCDKFSSKGSMAEERLRLRGRMERGKTSADAGSVDVDFDIC